MVVVCPGIDDGDHAGASARELGDLEVVILRDVLDLGICRNRLDQVVVALELVLIVVVLARAQREEQLLARLIEAAQQREAMSVGNALNRRGLRANDQLFTVVIVRSNDKISQVVP